MTFDRPETVNEEQVLDALVEVHRCRLLAAEAMEQAAALSGEEAPVEDVVSVLAQACAALENSQARNKASTMDQFLTDLHLCLDHASDRCACEKWCSSRAFAHKHQISTRAEGSEYRNLLQQQMAEAARREIDCIMAPASCPRRGRGGNPANFTMSIKHACGESILAGSLRKGMRVVCPRSGKPGIVQEITQSKTGKHGHAKVLMTVLGED